MNPFIFNAPADGKDARKQAIIAQIMGQGAPAPQSPGQGAAQGLNSIMGGLALRKQNQGAFPTVPGGTAPSFGQGLMNLFGLTHGGLY